MTKTVVSETLLSEKARQQIDKWTAKYPPEHKASAVLSALTIVQEENSDIINLINETSLETISNKIRIY